MRLVEILGCAMALTIAGAPAWAQDDAPGRRRRPARMQQLAPEKAKAAWEWQARSVAEAFKLTDGDAGRVTEIYVVARQQLVVASRENRREAGERRAREDRAREDRPEAGEGDGRRRGQRPLGFGMNPELLTKARADLETGLAWVLDAEQLKPAMASLGSFNRQWDIMVDAILGFELGTEKTLAALEPVRVYVALFYTLREAGDRQAMREDLADARETLLSRLEAFLDDEHLEQFTQLNRRRGRRPGGERAAGERPGGERQRPDDQN